MAPKKSKKILYLITSSGWGGANRYLFDIAKNLKSNYKIKVASGGTGLFTNRLSAEKIEHIPLKYLKNTQNPLTLLLAYLEIKKLLKNLSPDILHSNSTIAGLLGTRAATSLGIKSVFTAHGLYSAEQSLFAQKFGKLIDQTIIKNSDKIILLGKAEKKSALALGAKPSKIAVIQNGISGSSHFIPSKNSTFTVGTLANLEPNKNLSAIIELAVKNKGIKFKIAGEGPERKSLARLIHQNNLTNIELLGFQKNPANFLTKLDLVILPSNKEGMPYAVLEAASLGIPIIATTVGALPEIKPHFSGLLVPPADINALNHALHRIIKFYEIYKKDANILAPKIPELYSLEETLQKTTDLYNSL